MELSSLRPHDHFIIRTVKVGREVGRRLADMGFTEGTDGFVVRRVGFGGPIQVNIRGYDLLLRRDEAAKIDVELVASVRHGHGRRRRRWFESRPDFD